MTDCTTKKPANWWPLEIKQGGTVERELAIADSDGVAMDLTGYTVTCTARHSLSDQASVNLSSAFSIPTPTNGKILATFTAALTATLSGSYIFDLFLTYTGGEPKYPVAEGVITIRPKVP